MKNNFLDTDKLGAAKPQPRKTFSQKVPAKVGVNAKLATPLAWDAKKQENLAIFDEVPELVERAILSEAGVRNLRKKTRT